MWTPAAAMSTPLFVRRFDGGRKTTIFKIRIFLFFRCQKCAGEAQAAAVEKALGYFVSNVERMQYRIFRSKGFFIG
jgi:hypothetical protein